MGSLLVTSELNVRPKFLIQKIPAMFDFGRTTVFLVLVGTAILSNEIPLSEGYSLKGFSTFYTRNLKPISQEHQPEIIETNQPAPQSSRLTDQLRHLGEKSFVVSPKGQKPFKIYAPDEMPFDIWG